MPLGCVEITPVKWGTKGKERKGEKQGLITGWIGQRPTRLRAEEVVETGRKINIEATVSGWRLRYLTTSITVLMASFSLQLLLCNNTQ